MALPKSLRIVAGVTMVVLCFMLYQIFRIPSTTTPDGVSRFDDMVRDPNLDRKHRDIPEDDSGGDAIPEKLTLDRTQRLENHRSPYGESKATTTRPTTQTRTA